MLIRSSWLMMVLVVLDLSYPSVQLFCQLWKEGFWSLQLQLFICIFLFSFLSDFVSCIFHLCCLVHTHVGLLCLLGELAILSLFNILLYPWQFLFQLLYFSLLKFPFVYLYIFYIFVGNFFHFFKRVYNWSLKHFQDVCFKFFLK